MKALSTNRLASSPQYEKILYEYNQEFEKTGGKVNEAKFYRDIVLPALPKYHIQSWYQFLRRFKTTAGLLSVQIVNSGRSNLLENEEVKLEKNLLSNEIATRLGIQRALNIGAARLQEIMENPHLMTAKDAMDLLFKAMKAQDSRIHAIGKIREDSREQSKFEQAFDLAVYEE